MNSDTITTVTQVVKSGILILSVFGVNISPESTTIILTAGAAVYSLVGLIQGWFTNKKVN